MKKRPLHLAEAVPDNSSELFPASLFHDTAVKTCGSKASHCVADLLREQGEQLVAHDLRVVAPRSYLRSPPRRLHIIQNGFHSPHRAVTQAGIPTHLASVDDGPTSADTGLPNDTKLQRRPLPPLQNPPHHSLAEVSTDAGFFPGDATTEHVASYLKQFLATHPGVSLAQIVNMVGNEMPNVPATGAAAVDKPIASSGKSSRTPVVSSLLTTASNNNNSRSSPEPSGLTPRSYDLASSVRSSSIAQQQSSNFLAGLGSSEEFWRASHTIRDEVMDECLPYVPRIVLRNLDHTTEDSNDKDDFLGDGAQPARRGSAPTFTAWKGQAAVAFIDISGYSKVTTALAPLGAHALSDAVNGYLELIIDIVVNEFHGDIVKFAGDALLVVWTAYDDAMEEEQAKSRSSNSAKNNTARITLTDCCRIATACALALQRRVAIHNVPNSGGLTFSLHIGVVCGLIETAVFYFSDAQNTEAAFHSISGAPLQEVGRIVDKASSKETCVSPSVFERLRGCSGLKWVELTIEDAGAESALQAVDALAAPPAATPSDGGDTQQLQAQSTRNLLSASAGAHSETCFRVDGLAIGDIAPALVNSLRMREWLHYRQHSAGAEGEVECEEEGFGSHNPLKPQALRDVVSHFLHPALLHRFSSASSSSKTSAEMRFLAVMFIAKTDLSLGLLEWFSEVQHVLDAHRCAVVKLIDDDKGVHVIAAVGLFVSERNACLTAVEAARDLQLREAGCCTGIAAGLTFCGIVGSDVSCRWDVTGAACVRSCRLMQQAVALKPVGDCLIDSSVLDSIGNRSVLSEYVTRLAVKGSTEPVQVFVLAGSTYQPTWLLTAAPGNISDACHQRHRRDFKEFIESRLQSGCSRIAVVLSGGAGIGKSVLAVSVAQQLLISSVVHECSRSAGSSGNSRNSAPESFSIVKTIAGWFSFSPVPELQTLAEAVLNAHSAQHTNRTRRLLLQLISAALEKNVRTAIVVKQAQWLDTASVSFLAYLLRTNECQITPPQLVPVETDIEPAESSSAPSPTFVSSSAFGSASNMRHVVVNTVRCGAFVVVLCVTPISDAMSSHALLRHLRAPTLSDTPEVVDRVQQASLLLELVPLPSSATRDVACKTFAWDIDDSLFEVICDFCGGNPACIQAFCRHIMAQRPYITSMSNEGVVFLSPSAKQIIEAAWNWMTIFPAYIPQLLQLYDACGPKHRVVLRTIAALAPSHHDDTTLWDVVKHVTTKMLRHLDDNAFVALVRDLRAFGLVEVRDAPRCSKALEWLKVHDVSTSATATPLQPTCKPKFLDDNKSNPPRVSVSFVKSLRLSATALRDGILQTLTPDHRKTILRTAAKYLSGVVEAKKSGAAYPWACALHLTLRSMQYRVMSQQQHEAEVIASADMLLDERRYASICSDSEHDMPGDMDPIRFFIISRLQGTTPNQPAALTSSASSIIPISLDVVAVKNYVPPIALGFSVAASAGDLCFWFKNACTIVARKRMVPDKAAERGRAMAIGFIDALKRIAMAVDSAKKNGYRCSESQTQRLESFFGSEAIQRHEQMLVTLVDNMIVLRGHSPTAAESAADACRQFLQFLKERLEPAAQSFEECIVGVFVATPLMSEDTLPPRMDAVRRVSVVACIRALNIFKHALGEVQDTERLGSPEVVERLRDDTKQLFHSALMRLAVSEYNTRSAKYSLPWLRDMVLKEKRETTRAFFACVYAGYVGLTTASGRASIASFS